MGVKILVHIQIFTPVKVRFALKGIQQSGLILKQMSKRNSFFRRDILSNIGILMKITKNLVSIASSFWTRHFILKDLYATFAIHGRNLEKPLSPPKCTSSHWRCSIKNLFLKTSQYLPENTCVGVFFNKRLLLYVRS